MPNHRKIDTMVMKNLYTIFLPELNKKTLHQAAFFNADLKIKQMDVTARWSVPDLVQLKRYQLARR